MGSRRAPFFIRNSPLIHFTVLLFSGLFVIAAQIPLFENSAAN